MNNSDNWVVLKIQVDPQQEPFYKLLQGWSGGYTTGDSWHINSGITKVAEDEDTYTFFGASGSEYCVNKTSYGVRMNIAGVLASLQGKYPNCIEVMPDCDWGEFKWSTKDD